MHTTPACHTVGQIIKLDSNGHLVIKWADGSVSQRYPQEVFVVSDEVKDLIVISCTGIFHTFLGLKHSLTQVSI